MDMNWQLTALVLAGVIGSGTAVVHGVLTQRLMVKPIETALAANGRIAGPIRRIVPLLLHMSTVAWFLGGLALIAAAQWAGEDLRLWTGLFVGSLFLYGAVGNFWGTRGRHPGWMLLAASVALIGYGVS
jgi:hypothetical protein